MSRIDENRDQLTLGNAPADGTSTTIIPVDNMEIYNKARTVPASAQKTIDKGRIAGKTSINPMWRIEKLTELFGACGFGWYYDVVKQWTEVSNPDTISAFVDINLYVKHNEEWSKPIFGTGGSSFLAKEHSGNLHTDNDCYKKALTDAISVACKSLGIGADIYMENDDAPTNTPTAPQNTPNGQIKCVVCNKAITSEKSIEYYTKNPNARRVCYHCKDKDNQSPAIKQGSASNARTDEPPLPDYPF